MKSLPVRSAHDASFDDMAEAAADAVYPCAGVLRSAMPDADINLLIALDALLAQGGVAGAARRLGLSASATRCSSAPRSA